MAVDKINVLDGGGVDALLEKVFRIVEDNYIRRTEYATDIAAVNAKFTDGSVTKVGTQTVGSANQGIYLLNGVPTATTGGGGVPTSHASTTTEYGGGDATHYGHVELSDNYESSAGSAAQSVGASSKAVADAYSAAKTYMDTAVDDMFGDALTFEIEDGDLYVSYNVTSTAEFAIRNDGYLTMTY